jgi:hypothetical protein
LATQHNPESNTFLLIGAGIQHQPAGRIFGAATDSEYQPGVGAVQALPVNLTTGAADPNGTTITPDHMFDTVLRAGGAAPATTPQAIAGLLA